MMRLSVLQFCDFYMAIMAVWVTLVIMADLHPKIYSLLHMAGAIGVALGVEYDRTGLWVFVIPVAVGIAVLSASWVGYLHFVTSTSEFVAFCHFIIIIFLNFKIWHCQQQKACFPEKRIWLLCLLPGVLLAAVGLACYAFLETEENYKYVHSGWHVAMALCILFLLPPARQRPHKGRQRNPLEAQHSGRVGYIRADEMMDILPHSAGLFDHLLPDTP